MPHRLIPILDSVLMTFISIGIFISSLSLIALIPTILATLFWMGKLKREAEKNHNGNIWNYFKYLLKKNS